MRYKYIIYETWKDGFMLETTTKKLSIFFSKRKANEYIKLMKENHFNNKYEIKRKKLKKKG